MIIDFHTHIFPSDVARDRARYLERDEWFAECYENPKARIVEAGSLVASMDRAGIDKSVVCGFCWRDPGLCSYHNDYIVEAIQRFPDRLIGLAMVNPARGREALVEIERCFAAGLRGIGELNADAQGFDLTDRTSLEPVVSSVIDRGGLMLLHTSEPVGHSYPGKGTTDPRLVYGFVKSYPDLKLVCAHWGGGLLFYELMPEVADAARSVCYDTSASTLLYRQTVFEVAVHIVAPRKILFGTDYPLLRQDTFLSKVRSLQLPEPVLADILGGNALRLLGNG